MKTPMTTPGMPEDLASRWSHLEAVVSGDLEEECLALIRHVVLGCPVCREEEVYHRLSSWPEHFCTVREAVRVTDFLAVQYLTSPQGCAEFDAMRSGVVPVFLHPDGRPAAGEIQKLEMESGRR